jgi:hypothetical protein
LESSPHHRIVFIFVLPCLKPSCATNKLERDFFLSL